MKQIIFGDNPLTTIAGYILAGLYAMQTAMSAGPTPWYNIVIPVAIAIFGRVAGDTGKNK